MTSSSGTYGFAPPASDFVLEAYSRIGIRAGALNGQHMWDARMSCNLLLSQWSVRVPNLWLVELLSIPLTQGVATYNIPTNVVTLLDAYIRTYQVGSAVNISPAFTTTINSATVGIYWPNHNLYATEWINVNVPVSVGGIVVQGFYQVASVIDVNNVTIVAQSAATGSVTLGGVVPQFLSQASSSLVYVTLPNHGYTSTGQNFTVQVSAYVGGLTLLGTYQVQNVVSTTVFTISVPGLASSNSTVYENGGLASFQAQTANTDPIDRVINPISRTNYSNQPDKFTQDFPTTYWLNRQINPLVTLWPTPDQNGPYVLNVYAVTQPQDAITSNGVGINMPYRFYEAFAAGLARRLARKYAPMMVQELTMEEGQAWAEASQEDTENVPMYIAPGMGGYFR